MKPRRVTMQDVADKAPESLKTAVSMAFNDNARLSETTLKLIMATAAELGYSAGPRGPDAPHPAAPTALGLLLPQQLDETVENPYYSQFLQGIGQTCQQRGLHPAARPRRCAGRMLKPFPLCGGRRLHGRADSSTTAAR